jgi:hypothetical protein
MNYGIIEQPEENVGIVAKSEEGFENSCRDKGLEKSEFYPIFNFKDLELMIQESPRTRVALVFGHDAIKTGISDFGDVRLAKNMIKEHNVKVIKNDKHN